jgi:hypothetical protein
MNQSQRWKTFTEWWNRTFPAGKKLDGWSPYQVVNMIGDKVFEIKSMGKSQKVSKGRTDEKEEN